MAASSGEEEEYEYEEVEVEEEVDDDEQIQEEEEEEPEEEEEEEPEEEEEEEEEELVEDDDEPMEEEEEEEEEYEEIEEEIEVTDDEDEHMEVAVLEEEVVDTSAIVAEVTEETEVTAAEEVAEEEKVEYVVESCDLPVTIADHLQNDVRQDEQSKENEVCSKSRIQDTMNSELAAPLDIYADEPIGSKLGSMSPSQQNRKGKEVMSIDDGSSSLPERLKSVADPPKLGDNTVEGEQGLVEISPLSAPVKGEQTHGKPIIPAVTSENRVSTPDGIHDKLRKIETTVIDETRVPSQKEDLHLPSSGNIDQKALRYYTPQMRPRSTSPVAECEVISKRSAMVCEYFAKGWCIKGSSCRFLHKRDQADFVRGQVEGDMMSTKAEICPGSGDAGGSNSLVHQKPKFYMTNSDDRLPISNDGRYTEKDHRDHINDKDNFRLFERDFSRPHTSISSQRSPSSKDVSKVFSSQNEAEVDMLKGNHSSDHLDHQGSSVPFGRSTLLDNFTPGHGFLSRGTGVNSGTQMNYSLHSYAMVDESVDMRRQYTLDLHSSPIRGFSAKSSVPFRNSSLLDNSSLKDLLLSYKNERKFTPYKWEPSIPFRPSHFITSFTTSSSDVQYDPLRDSIDQQELGRGSFRHSSYGQTQGLTYQHGQSISGRNSLESHKRLHSDSNYKDYYSHDKDAPIVEAESAAVSATNPVNKNISDEENPENPVVATSVKDVLKSTKCITDGNSKLKIEDSRHKGEVRKQNNELHEEDSKVIKSFRAALIEFVKELMKPVWHEGRLSKDVYKVIVQKAEDKILSTLLSNEVPNTPESIKQYLSSARPNILKLIQAYVDKYGKF